MTIHTYSGRKATKTFGLEVSRNRIDKMESKIKYGYDPDVDLVVEMITPVGNLDIPAAVVTTVDIFSSAANDTILGSHARKIKIWYLDDDYVEHTKEIEMSGAAKVEWTTADFFRFLGASVIECGATKKNEGNIEITNSDQSKTYGYIAANKNRAQTAMTCVPAGKTAYILQVNGSSGSYDDACIIDLVIEMDRSGVKRSGIYSTHSVIICAGTTHNEVFCLPIKVPEKTIIYLSAIATTGNEKVSGSFEYVLVDLVE